MKSKRGVARTWWKRLYKDNKSYLIESDPFNNKSKARTTEWEAIYKGFNISPLHYPKLVDFGCGSGHFTLNFLKMGFEVTGIDIEREALKILIKRGKKYGFLNKLHVVCDGLEHPINDMEGKFDAGCMIVTYHCISNDQSEQKKIFRNFIKLIRRGGKILIMEPNPLNPLFYIFYKLYYKGNIQEGQNIINSKKEILVNLLRETGMSEITIFRHSFLPTSFINRWSFIKNFNEFLCSVPGIRNFSAFHIITAVKNIE